VSAVECCEQPAHIHAVFLLRGKSLIEQGDAGELRLADAMKPASMERTNFTWNREAVSGGPKVVKRAESFDANRSDIGLRAGIRLSLMTEASAAIRNSSGFRRRLAANANTIAS
jgi:hypothetical protein